MASGRGRDKSGDPSDEIAHAATASPMAGTAPSESPGIGERPDSDEIARAVAKARIANQLFAKQDRVKLGRYHLLEMVGAGGMGVVWGAWDPELDRRVAIKLVKATMQAARDRILLEGQALAKLSHPNVVPVYDVGVVDEQVHLVMEWVRGKNLRAWCKEPRTIREILGVYRAAGEGLLAAHRAGLIHRDFKPDNAMIGDDGRVRVLDFGLARGEVKASQSDSDETVSSDLTRGAGTPRYMPVEQAEGRELTPAVDQYAFCVSLRESLVGRNADGEDAAVPGWLDEILTKGTSREPTARYGSMDELLRALARDPATVWRRRALVAGALGLAGATFAIGTTRGEQIEPCIGGEELISHSWNDPIRDKMVAHLRTLGPYGQAEASRLVGVFDRYKVDWADAHETACKQQDRRDVTPQLYEINLACLARTRVAFETSIELANKADSATLSNVATAVAGLPAALGCLDLTHRSKLVLPPPPSVATQVRVIGTQVERARILTSAVDESAIPFTKDLVARAKTTDYKPLIAEALLEQGHAHLHRFQHEESNTAFAAASQEAFETGDLTTAIHAYSHLIYSVGVDNDALRLAKWSANNLKGSSSYARALLYNAEGGAASHRGDAKTARKAFSAAVDTWDRSPEHVELAFLFVNLAIIAEERKERDSLFSQAIQDLSRSLGPDHPSVFDTRMTSAIFVEDPRAAIRELQDMCFRWQSLHGHMVQSITTCMYDLGWLAEEQRDVALARRAMRYVVDKLAGADADKPGDEARVSEGYLLLLDGKFAEAARTMTELANKLVAAQVAYFDLRAADAFVVAAMALERGGLPGVVATYERALAILEQSKAFAGRVFYQRRLARVLAAVARLRRADDPARARLLARRAVEWYRSAGGYDEIVRELAAITDSR